MKHKQKQYMIAIILLGVIFLAIHLYIQPSFGDEVNFRKKLLNYDYHIFSLLKWRWFNWSSRVVLEFFMFVVASLPSIIWKVIDCIFIYGLFYVMSQYTDEKLFLSFGLCAYPFMHLASAGWLATTTNYLWPFVTGLMSFYIITMRLNRKYLKIYWTILYFLLLIYTVSSELMSIIYLLGIGLLCIDSYLYNCKKILIQKWIIIGSIFVCIIGIIIAIVCPGNSFRMSKEIARWMPEYRDLSLFDRLRICTVSTIQHFTSIPNIIFILLGCMIFVVLILFHKKWYQILVSFIPLLISLGLTLYYGYSVIIKKRNLNYIKPTIIIQKGTWEYYTQIILMVMAFIYLVSMLCSLYWIFKDNQKTSLGIYRDVIINIGIYIGGLISRFVLIFSPTMIASGTRIYFVLYMAQIWIMNKLFCKITNKKVRMFFNLLCGFGIIINIIMVVLMQRKYS